MVADYNGFDRGLSSMNCNDFDFLIMLCSHNSYIQYVNPYCKIKLLHTLYLFANLYFPFDVICRYFALERSQSFVQFEPPTVPVRLAAETLSEL